jgi:hypothetical protein
VKAARANDPVADRINAWWIGVIVGHPAESHPIYGDALKVKLRHGVLHLSGEVASRQEWQSAVGEARRYVRRGVDDVNATRLRVARRDEQVGILDQRLIAAFPNREIAEYALAYVLEHSRVEPKRTSIVDSAQDQSLGQLGDFASDAQAAHEAGNSILVLCVDETEAFEVHELLDEETGSLWTIALPPERTSDGGN